ncbi:hypothetical protein HD806DRAFT_525491 [Xylariaceae sp. AK1471]|nr:hypothetical protein HD806DRAFT_525491 [Xylariaceae sp. AK1471]
MPSAISAVPVRPRTTLMAVLDKIRMPTLIPTKRIQNLKAWQYELFPRRVSKTENIQGWPTGPLKVKAKPRSYLSTVVLFVILSLYIGHKGPTIFPVVFVSPLGRTLQSIGRLCSERGIELGNLHYLMTTRSSSDAISAITRISYVSPVITLSSLLWALSPLGGQASLRVLYTVQRITSTIGTIRYLDTGPLRHSLLDWSLNEDGLSRIQQDLDAGLDATMFSAMEQPTQTLNGPTDSWGNAKIPIIDHLHDSEGSDAWWDTTRLKGADSYSSVLGIPVHEIPLTGTNDLSIETSYLKLNCSSLTRPKFYGGPVNDFNFRLSCPNCPAWNISHSSKRCKEDSSYPWCSRLAAFLGLELPHTTNIDRVDTRTNFIIVDIWTNPDTNSHATPQEQLDRNQGYAWSTTCAVAEIHVEAKLRCESERCHANSIRYSQIDKRPPNITPLDYWASKVLPSGLNPGIQTSSIASYLRRPNEREMAPPDFDSFYSDVTAEQFSVRLGAILNTYLQIYLASNLIHPLRVSQTLTSQRSSLEDIWGPEYTPVDGLKVISKSSDLGIVWTNIRERFKGYGGSLRYYATTNVTTSNSNEVYRADPLWITLLVLCSLSGITIGIVGLICEARSLAPDRFDPVLGLTFDNTELGLPLGGSAVGVDDRLCLLNQLVVRVGDVARDEEIGRIGLAIESRVSPVRRERFYK